MMREWGWAVLLALGCFAGAVAMLMVTDVLDEWATRDE
jgi:hypothetical protein